VDARVGAVAVALGLVNEAQKLFAGCGRYDLLNKLHQAAGEWDSALAVAERYDRIHLKATHFQLARHLESIDDPAGAVRHYEAADAGAAEVPRMLYGAGELGELERCGTAQRTHHCYCTILSLRCSERICSGCPRDRYVESKQNGELTKWWAAYCKSPSASRHVCAVPCGGYLIVFDVGRGRTTVSFGGNPAEAKPGRGECR
jgi:hypothetical protein